MAVYDVVCWQPRLGYREIGQSAFSLFLAGPLPLNIYALRPFPAFLIPKTLFIVQDRATRSVIFHAPAPD